jgi:hypothetical protein
MMLAWELPSATSRQVAKVRLHMLYKRIWIAQLLVPVESIISWIPNISWP